MTQPLVQYALLALGLIASLALFVVLKQEIQANARRYRRGMEQLAEQLAAPAGPAPRSGFNLNRRAQALRLLRRGESVSHVAASVGVPEREIELLVRVQKITASASN